MSTAGGWARAAALVLAVLVLDQAVGRFVLGHDLLGGLRDAAQAAAGLARFQAAWPFALLQVAAAAAAAWWGRRRFGVRSTRAGCRRPSSPPARCPP